MSSSNDKLEEVLKGLTGNIDGFRKSLLDKDEWLAQVCDYAEREAENRRCEPWSIIKGIISRGSGVSAAFYELYRRK